MNNNQNISKQSLGGQATARKLRKDALDRYYLSPSICLYCKSVIEVLPNQKVNSVRIKKFCNRSCAAKHNNSLRPKKHNTTTCVQKPRKQKYDYLIGVSKDQLFSTSKNWQSARSTIARNARYIYHISDRPLKCKVCGYSRHVDVCHIKAVSEFSDSSLISDINSIENLIVLCPNHHWEFDHGLLKL